MTLSVLLRHIQMKVCVWSLAIPRVFGGIGRPFAWQIPMTLTPSPADENVRLKSDLYAQLARIQELEKDIEDLKKYQESKQTDSSNSTPNPQSVPPTDPSSPFFFAASCFSELAADYSAKISAVYAELAQELQRLAESSGIKLNLPNP